MKENKRNKLKTTLQIIMYIFIILSFLRSFLAKASAEEMPKYVQEYLFNDMDSHFTNWRIYQTQINTIVSECPYFVRYNLTIGSTNYVFYDFFKYEHLGINNVFINNYFYSEGSAESGSGYIMTKSNANILSSTGVTAYRFVISNSSTLYYILSYTCTSSTPTRGAWFNTGYFYTGGNSYYLRLVNASVSSSSFYVNTSSYVGYGNLFINNSKNNFVGTTTTVPDPVDSRFSAYTTLDDLGKPVLNVKWDSQVYPTTGSFNYVKSVLSLTIDKNGTGTVVSFDSEEYPELFINATSSYIPYMYINKVANIVTSESTDILTLTKIQLTQYAYPSGASSSSATAYTASTIYNLNLNTPEMSNPDFDYSHSNRLDNQNVPSAPPVFDTPYFTDTNSIQTKKQHLIYH